MTRVRFCVLIIITSLLLTLQAATPPVKLDIKPIVLNYGALAVPLRVYTADNKLIAEYGEKRRKIVRYAQLPKHLINAYVAIRDPDYFKPPTTKAPSPITLSLVKMNAVSLTYRLSLRAKMKLILLGTQLEKDYSRQTILEHYLNKLYLGNRSYGVQAAAYVYFGKKVQQLNLAECAMLAALQFSPSRYNPITNPKVALSYRNHVLKTMRKHQFITTVQYQQALATPLLSKMHAKRIIVQGHYVAEMVRAHMVKEYGNKAYRRGFKVYTTIDSKRQNAMVAALRRTILFNERQVAYKGPIAKVPQAVTQDDAAKDEVLKKYYLHGNLQVAMVIRINQQGVRFFIGTGVYTTIPRRTLSWLINKGANGAAPTPDQIAKILAPGDIVYLEPTGKNQWQLAMQPKSSGAAITLAARTGAVVALVGGYDFYALKFNRVTQMYRQAGNLVVPLVTAAAIQYNLNLKARVKRVSRQPTKATPKSKWVSELAKPLATPKQQHMTLQQGLLDLNTQASLEVVGELGLDTVLQFFNALGLQSRQPRDPSWVAVGTGGLSPFQLVQAYAVFRNQGYTVTPYFIQKITRIGNDGEELVYEASPKQRCRGSVTIGCQARILSAAQHQQLLSWLKQFNQRHRLVELSKMPGQTQYLLGYSSRLNDLWSVRFSSQTVSLAWFGYDDIKPVRSGNIIESAMKIWSNLNIQP